MELHKFRMNIGNLFKITTVKNKQTFGVDLDDPFAQREPSESSGSTLLYSAGIFFSSFVSLASIYSRRLSTQFKLRTIHSIQTFLSF